MKRFDAVFNRKENVFFSDSQALLGLRVSLSFNFSDLKFISSESAEKAAGKALSAFHFLYGGKRGKSGDNLFLDEKSFKAAREKFFIPYCPFRKGQILTEENGFYWAFNFAEHGEVFSFCHDCGGFETLMEELLKMRERINSFTPLAWCGDFGFLSANPRLCGNMARIGAALHLPALKKSGKIINLFKEAEFLRMKFGSLFDDLPDTSGFYQLSAYGGFLDEKAFVKKTVSFLQAIVQREKEEREKFFSKNEFADEAFRALGIFKYCRLLGFYESISLLSSLKAGADAGFFSGIKQGDIPRALTAFAPKTADYLKKEKNKTQQQFRAEISRSIFESWREKSRA